VVGAVDAVPPDQQILREVPAPLLIFKEFLAHEELRNPGRRQQQRIGYAGATARVPGALVVSISDARDTLLVSLLDDVMILDAGDGSPAMIHAGREQRGSDGVKVSAGSCTIRALVDRRADGDPQVIVLHHIEAMATMAG
jgi:hypothetical protein